MKEFVWDETLGSFEQEMHVLGWFRDNMPKSPKKLIAMSRYIRPLVPDYFQRTLCDNIERPDTKDPIKFMNDCLREMVEFPKIIAQMVKDGHHGMIFDHGTLYPISLKAWPHWLSGHPDERWSEESEREIGNAAVAAWMVENRRRTFDDRFVLFEEFGFSGISMKSEWVMPEEDWINIVKPLRDAERKAERDNRAISRLINGTRKRK